MTPQPLKFTRIALAAIVLALTVAGTACSSAPGDSDGRRYFEAKGNEENLFKVKSFTKTNGSGDDKQYAIQYVAELECLKTKTKPPWAMLKPYGIDIECDHAGQILERKGTLVFTKTEKGWLVVPDISN